MDNNKKGKARSIRRYLKMSRDSDTSCRMKLLKRISEMKLSESTSERITTLIRKAPQGSKESTAEEMLNLLRDCMNEVEVIKKLRMKRIITTKEAFIEALENEIREQGGRLEHGWHRDDFVPFEILYGCPMEIVREVIEMHPEYLRQWPLLEDYIK